ncbi:hypothetical protein ACFWBI_13410 [Streptomyces sp. NPDC059982]|uniref:hypothetical protein n=1 Tax=unclassified Streptomyces TaxID=2593676 RepID=UPI0036A0BD53
MLMHRKRAAGAALAAVLLVAGATACEGGKKDGAGKAAPSAASVRPSEPPAPAPAAGNATEALTAAYKKTSAAKSAKVHMTMKMSGGLGGESVEMTGVQGWDPQVMDMTMKGGPGQSGVESVHMIMDKDVMYMELPTGSPMAAGMEGKRWMKIDIKAAAEASGDAEALKQLGGVGDLGGMGQSQDPAKQLGMLLASPNVKLVGPEKIAGADTRHYKGTLTAEEMLAANKGATALPEADRTKLTDAMKKAGIKGYDMDVWVDEDGYPARMKVAMGTPEGSLDVDASYSDYTTTATVQAPPDNETVDLFGMLSRLGEDA